MKLIELGVEREIPGLLARAFDPTSDYPAMAALLNSVSYVDGWDRIFRAEQLLRNDNVSSEGFDPSRDRYVVEVKGEVVGMGLVEAGKSAGQGWFYYHSFELLPHWRGKGIGTAALAKCQELIRGLARLNSDTDANYYHSYHLPSRHTRAMRLLEKHGYEPHRTSLGMVRLCSAPVPDCEFPTGLSMRALESDDLRKVWEAMEEAFSESSGVVTGNEAMFNWWKSNPEMRPQLSRVAWDGHEVAGMVIVHINAYDNQERNRKRAVTETVCVRKKWRRSGIAKALLAECLRLIQKTEMTEVGLSVNAQNPTGAVSLYEKMGYVITSRSVSFRKPT